ncbi:MAG: hypothetical protein H6737_24450 [Alphaproteobacteria bacterium]|nr:hypothetical protein [Alphaproteobacteria bacterium]
MKLLAVHGITMTGPSLRAHLGAVRDGLEAAGFELITPTAPHALSEAAMAGQQRWVTTRYAEHGQDAAASFRDGVFWDGSGHFGDWLVGRDGPNGRIYAGLEDGLATIAAAVEGQDVVGVLGFSQGAAMASIVLGRMLRGALPGRETLRFGVLMSGFRPSFAEPALDVFPVPPLPVCILHGRRDPIFPDADATVAELASGFGGPVTTRILDDLGHVVPQDPAVVDAIVAFCRAAVR